MDFGLLLDGVELCFYYGVFFFFIMVFLDEYGVVEG